MSRRGHATGFPAQARRFPWEASGTRTSNRCRSIFMASRDSNDLAVIQQYAKEREKARKSAKRRLAARSCPWQGD